MPKSALQFPNSFALAALIVRRTRPAASLLTAVSVFIGLLVLIAIPSASVQAQVSTILRGEFTEVATELAPSMAPMDGAGSKIAVRNAVVFSGKVPGVGMVRFTLRSAEQADWQATITTGSKIIPDPTLALFVSGEAVKVGSGVRLPVSGVLTATSRRATTATLRLFINSTASASAAVSGRSSRVGRRAAEMTLVLPLAKRERPLTEIVARLRTIPPAVVQRRRCHRDGKQPHQNSAGHSAGPTAGHSNTKIARPRNLTTSQERRPILRASSTRSFTISTDADYQYFLQYGANTNAHIASIVKSGSELYSGTFDINFRIVGQNVFSTLQSSPYVETEAEAMLEEFYIYSNRFKHLKNADIYHLFTGRDIDDSTIGVAYVGVVCKFSNEYSYGISQRFHPALDATTFTHEVGHNFSATHDTADPQGIMFPRASLPAPIRWSTLSIKEISSFVSTIACYDEVAITAVPTPSSAPTLKPTLEPTIVPPTVIPPTVVPPTAIVPTINVPTATASPRATATPVPAISSTPAATPRPTRTGGAVATATPTRVPSFTSTPVGTVTANPNSSPVPTATTVPMTPVVTPNASRTPASGVPVTTPPPTVSSTATPVNVVTPSNGEKPGISPTIGADANFSLSLALISRGGETSVNLSYTPWDASCSVEILGGSAQRGIPETVIYSQPLVATELSYRAKNRRPGRGRLQLRAKVTCPATGGIAFTDALETRMRGRDSSFRVTAVRWLRSFIRSFRPTKVEL